ncbi:5-formyltetrahydrofolate cyclo-ligase [Lingula anatina]|uniref:5-formyltetrahydrofolate cyclo-ligase n=1 Tax=Lingula anatina TaxID=7574 RepID=A0A1S3JK03_LINAN|nr:5-formyltetrahydrofolate cyclo-ligase [Lingula anatina]|eukprot:XP_013410707.1 5-formyltetrahydrofolate cyclo-ligase [Lingula anatina]
MASTSIRAAKNALRKEIKKKIACLSDEEKKRQSEIVTRKLFQMPQYQSSQRVSVFLNMHDEIHTLPIVKNLLENNKKCYIPRYIGTTMDMVRLLSLQDYEDLPVTSWKIKQPADDEQREDAITTGGLDLILVPGLSFTKDGDRLGRGKGYYDTYLSRCEKDTNKKPYTIALAYKEQVLESVPTDELDFRIDTVLYEDSAA